MRPSVKIAALVLGATAGWPALAAEAASDEDLAKLSIEQLAQIEVRSASKTDEPLSSAPTALYVLTRDEIVNSGVNSLPEALRLAPNLQVQQVDASQYAISSRGFNGLEASNKLLVLIDGRSVYTPLASSVFWNLHSPVLEDIQQIEIISGPGGTLYGPNAVNGVVNVTTANSQDTIGTLARASAGALEQTAAVRHGFTIGRTGAMRVYANWHAHEGFPGRSGGPDTDDDWRGWQAGFRSDFGDESGLLTVQGDLFRADADTLPGDGAKGQNLLARWSKTLSPNASFEVQTYYDYFKRKFTLVEDSVSTLDGQEQFNLTFGPHTIVAGGGIRTTKDRFINNLNIFQLNPQSRRLWVYNLIAQDRISLTPTVDLIGGLKVERSTFTGWQLLPNLRLAWTPSDRALVWAAVSRAVRTPNRIDRQLEAENFLAQSTEFTSEKLVAFEAGFRGQPTASTSFSISGFVNSYADLRTTELVDGALPFQLMNGWKGRTYGVEAWGSAQVQPWWRVSVGATTLHKDLHLKAGHSDLIPGNSLGNDPKWQVKLRNDFDIAPKLQLTLDGRAVGRIERDPEVDSYVELGGRLGYRFRDNLEFYVAGRNMLHRVHQESNNSAAQLAKRSVYVGTRVIF